jgi:hypothetical protein
MSKLQLSIGLCLLLGVVGRAPSAWSQEVKHAYSVDQCRADQRLWQAKLEIVEGFPAVSAKELAVWVKEMGECQKIDPALREAYARTRCEAIGAQAIRLFRFIQRHNLIDQYFAEDAQGKR